MCRRVAFHSCTWIDRSVILPILYREGSNVLVVVGNKNISSGGLYLTMQKYFSHPSLVIYFFPTPPIKLKLGLQIGGGLLIANYLNHLLWLGNQSREQESDHISYTPHRQVLDFVVHFTSLSKLCKNDGPKPFCWAKPACFVFSSSNLNLQGHILSTGGVALTSDAS